MGALLHIDRRYIFLAVFLVLAAVTLFGEKLQLPVEASKTVRGVYARLDALEPRAGRERAAVLVSMDFDPPSSPELGPMSKAVLRQLFRKGHRVIAMTHWPSGLAMAKGYAFGIAAEFDDVVVSYRYVGSEEEATKVAGERAKVVEGALAAVAAVGARAKATGEVDAEGRAKVLAAWYALAGVDPQAPPEAAEQRTLVAFDAAARLVQQPDDKLRGLTRAARGGLLLDANAYAANVAVFVPGTLEVTAQAGEGLPADAGLHPALAAAQPGAVAAAELSDGRHVVLEVLARFPVLQYGKDFCYLGMKGGAEILMVAMGQSIYDSFPTDTDGNATRAMEILKDVPTLRDIDYLVALAAGDTGEKWIQYGHEKFKFPMAVGCTAVMAPDLYPYLQAKQIDGIIGGIRGAWEYEKLTGIRGAASDKVPVQTAAHLIVILLIVICNVGYLLAPKGTK